MGYVGAFRWNNGKISYFFLDEQNFAASSISSVAVKDKQKAYEVINNFRDEMVDKDDKALIEYHILNSSVPWGGRQNPSPLSEYILDQFKQATQSVPNTTIAKQVKKELTGASLKLFKKALRDLGLAQNAEAWHLWSIALHATNSQVEKKIKNLWFATQQASMKNKGDVQKFEEWRLNLG